MEFLDLIRASKRINNVEDNVKDISVTILADSASQHIATALKGYGALQKLYFDIYDADYNQVDLQIFDNSSELYQKKPQWILFFLCTQKLYEQFCECSEKKVFGDEVILKIKNYYNHINANLKANIIQPLFIEEDNKIFGNYGLKIQESFIFQVKKINIALMELAVATDNLYLINPNDYLLRYSREKAIDLPQYCNSKLAFSLDVLPDMAADIVGIIRAKNGAVIKCVILDLDNTLWGGVIGDDGMEGIELGELGIGYAFTDFQMWLKELKQRGILLCVCSKNNEDTAKEPFEKHPDMVLRLEDIAMFVANWEDKASNIKMIQETLNIGIDSMVFIDDNPYERDVVRELVPGITVPDLPSDPALYKDYLISLNLFETVSYSAEDSDRTKQYQEESARKIVQKSFDDFNEYLKNIEMFGTCSRFEEFYYPRIAQLTQRSNQFNLRTVRYTETDIKRIAQSDEYIPLYFTLRDKFGDYGLISVVIMQKISDEELFVDTWLMSCRVLKRGVEEFVVNSFVEKAAEAGFKKIKGEYLPTKKNAIVKDLYSTYGFSMTEPNSYELFVREFKPFKHNIKF